MIQKGILICSMIIMLFASCDLRETAFIQFPLDQSNPDIVKVHIAVFEGPMNEENLILVQSVTTAKPEISVPAGTSLSFLLVSENSSGFAEDWGSVSNISFSDSDRNNLNVTMYNFDDQAVETLTFNMFIGQDSVLTWNNMGAANYKLSGMPAVGGTWQLVHSGPGLMYDTTLSPTLASWRIVCYFSYFDLESVPSYTYP